MPLTPQQITRNYLPTDYAPDFNYSGLPELAAGNWTRDGNNPWFTNGAGGYYTPFIQGMNTGGSPNAAGSNGHWTENGWVADPQYYFGTWQTAPDGSNRYDQSGGHNAPLYDRNTSQLMRFGGSLPGVTANAGFGHYSTTRPVSHNNQFAPENGFWEDTFNYFMQGPFIPLAGFLGAGLAAGAAGAGAGAGTAALEAGALAGAPGYGAALEGALGAGLGAGAGSASWGANMNGYDSFLQSIGIDPASTQFSGGTISNAEILQQLGQNPSWLQQITGNNMPTSLPGNDSSSTGSSPSPNTASNGWLNDWIQQNLGITGQQAGGLASALLGLFGSNSQANALEGIANNNQAFQQQAFGMGAPYRAAAQQMLTNPDSFFSGPVAQSNLQGVLQGLSVNGNPFGNPTSLALAQQGQRGLYNSTLSTLGQLGGLSGFNSAAANQSLATQLAIQQAQQQGNMWNAAGAGLNSLFNPQPSLAEILTALTRNGGLAGATRVDPLAGFGSGTWRNDENESLT